MSLPSYTVRTGHPRVLCTATDLSTQGGWIFNQTLTSPGRDSWLKIYQNGSEARKNLADASWFTSVVNGVTRVNTNGVRNYYRRVLAMLIGARLTLSTTEANSYYAKAISTAEWVCANFDTYDTFPSGHVDDGDGWLENDDYTRSLCGGLAFVFDMAYDRLSSSQKTTIGQGLMKFVNSLLTTHSHDVDGVFDEMMDGHTAGSMAFAFMGCLALYGESGFTTGTTNNANLKIDTCLKYWFGDATVTLGRARLDYDRYFKSDGGGGKGHWYEAHANWITAFFLHPLYVGMTSVEPMTLDGEDYTIPNSEPWIDRHGEWILHSIRGDGDFFPGGDALKSSGTLMTDEQRVQYAFYIRHSETWRRRLRWAYNAVKGLSPATSYEDEAVPFLMFDHNSALTQELPPATSPQPERSRLFVPPGYYSYKNTWDIFSPTNCQIVIHCPTYYWRGHNAELECGAIQVNVHDDMVVNRSGIYHTGGSDTGITNFGGDHNNAFKRQSIACSGIPLVDDGASTSGSSNTGQPHVNVGYPFPYLGTGGASTRPYYHAQGGQTWKYYASAVFPADVKDPQNPTDMIQNGADSTGEGQAWRKVIGLNGETNKTIEKKVETDDYCFLTAELYKAYLKEEADIGTSKQRVTLCQMRWLVIKREGTYPVIFMVSRVRSRLSSMQKMVPWQFYGQPIRNARGQWIALGHKATTDAGATSGGKVAIDYYEPSGSNYTFSTVGNNDTVWTTRTASNTKYSYLIGPLGSSRTRVSFPPATNPNSREVKDQGRWRLEAYKPTGNTEDYFVNMVVPMKKNESGPDYVFFEEADYFGVRFTDGVGQRVYKIHKTSDSVVGPGQATDTVPPVAVTNLVATATSSGRVDLTWDEVADDPTMENGGVYKVYKRVKV